MISLDLASTTLPDAIAAMVEAWLDAQKVDTELAQPLSADLIECIDYILNARVAECHLEGLASVGKNPTIKKLFQLRHRQGKGSKSHARAALSRVGIDHQGGDTSYIRIGSNAEVFAGLDPATEERYGNALLDAPGVKYVENSYRRYLEVPSSYFIDRCLA